MAEQKYHFHMFELNLEIIGSCEHQVDFMTDKNVHDTSTKAGLCEPGFLPQDGQGHPVKQSPSPQQMTIDFVPPENSRYC